MQVDKLKNRIFNNNDELAQALKSLYDEDKAEYIRQCSDSEQFRYDSSIEWPIINECIQEAGNFDQSYFFQDMWAAREIYKSGVKHVYDIGSRMDGYISHLLSMEVNVTMLDIRPFSHNIEGLSFIQTNAMDMSNIPDNAIQTLSSLCAIEHFGLGRYCDPIDYNGWKKALHSIKRKLRVGGVVYLSVPVGREDKLQFNAHRIFNPMTIINELSPELELYEFSYIDNWKINTCFKSSNDLSVIEFAAKNLIGYCTFGLFTFIKTKIITSPSPPHPCHDCCVDVLSRSGLQHDFGDART